jgi:hypothetical protein
MSETMLKVFKAERDETGKIPLKSKDGSIVRFTHAVDAREALEKKDPETGEQIYFLVHFKRKIAEPVIENEKKVEIKASEEPVLETPPVMNTFKKITPGRRGRPKAENSVPVEE